MSTPEHESAERNGQLRAERLRLVAGIVRAQQRIYAIDRLLSEASPQAEGNDAVSGPGTPLARASVETEVTLVLRSLESSSLPVPAVVVARPPERCVALCDSAVGHPPSSASRSTAVTSELPPPRKQSRFDAT